MILLSLKVNKHLALFDGQKINFVVSYICFGFFFSFYLTHVLVGPPMSR
jgi:hypothetical protein